MINDIDESSVTLSITDSKRDYQAIILSHGIVNIQAR
jgi:hypothetical protein